MEKHTQTPFKEVVDDLIDNTYYRIHATYMCIVTHISDVVMPSDVMLMSFDGMWG